MSSDRLLWIRTGRGLASLSRGFAAGSFRVSRLIENPGTDQVWNLQGAIRRLEREVDRFRLAQLRNRPPPALRPAACQQGSNTSHPDLTTKTQKTVRNKASKKLDSSRAKCLDKGHVIHPSPSLPAK